MANGIVVHIVEDSCTGGAGHAGCDGRVGCDGHVGCDGRMSVALEEAVSGSGMSLERRSGVYSGLARLTALGTDCAAVVISVDWLRVEEFGFFRHAGTGGAAVLVYSDSMGEGGEAISERSLRLAESLGGRRVEASVFGLREAFGLEEMVGVDEEALILEEEEEGVMDEVVGGDGSAFAGGGLGGGGSARVPWKRYDDLPSRGRPARRTERDVLKSDRAGEGGGVVDGMEVEEALLTEEEIASLIYGLQAGAAEGAGS